MAPTAATSRLHLGNLYSWTLADAYKRATALRQEEVLLRESWNCYSQRLQEEVRTEHPEFNEDELTAECRKRTETNIATARDIFSRYNFEFDQPQIRDDSLEYKEIVNSRFLELIKQGKIVDDQLILPPTERVIEMAQGIDWIPKNIWRRFYGVSSLENVKTMPVFRDGSYGISQDGMRGKVFGQRFVQSLVPHFYNQQGYQINLGLFGMDVLTKWVYFMISNSDKKPFDRIALSGLVLDKQGKKVSKYGLERVLAMDMLENPDNIRLFLLRQSFGSDFKVPNDFSIEEKFRRKVYNCLVFLEKYARISDGEISELPAQARAASLSISEQIRELNIQDAYNSFYNFIHNKVSREYIDRIRAKGIRRNELDQLIGIVRDTASVFIPLTANSSI